MKILLLNEMMDSGSVSFYIREQTAIELVRRGHEVTMISPSLKSPSLVKINYGNGVKYIFSAGILPVKYRRGGFGIIDLFTKIFYILFNNIDVVYTTAGHRPSQFIPALIAKKIKKIKIVDEWWEWYGKEGRAGVRSSVIGKIIGKYDDVFELKLKPHYDHVISISSYLQKRLVEIGMSEKRLSVLHGAINSDKFINYDIIEAKKKLDLDINTTIIGLIAVGELDHDDNKYFINSFLKQVESNPELRLFVTGEEKYIYEKFNHLLNSKVIYKGWLNFRDYNLHLSSCSYFALPLNPMPRNLGRWPHKFSEFVYLERPIITNIEGDQASLIRKYNIGYCIENSEAAYSLVLESILLNKTTIHADNFQTLKNELTLKSRVDKLEVIYKAIFNSLNK
jgi:hypothetical protein